SVITGASHGIGREFALQLAQRGFNVALVSRTASRLAQVAQEIEDLPGVKVSTIQHQIDFASAGKEEWAALQQALEPLDVGILVNNAGLNHDPALFASVSGAEAGAVVSVNSFAPVRVTSIVLPGMIARHRGLILNIGSIVGGAVPLPHMAVYSGTKAFILSWTQALATELATAKTGVDVRAVHLGFVADAMADFVKESAAIPSPKCWVQAALARVGLQGGAGRAFVSNPYWAHAFEEFF
ncbi:NAD(P)-binding protein, partial [Auricularia subglabra TFB-10046 SS5]